MFCITYKFVFFQEKVLTAFTREAAQLLLKTVCLSHIRKTRSLDRIALITSLKFARVYYIIYTLV